MLLSITLLQLSNIILVGILLFILFRYIETSWSYKISKPNLWEESVKQDRISGKLKRYERFYRDKVRFYNLWFQVNRLNKNSIPGSFAEIGVYKGETARIIHAMDNTRPFHLFDTFEGFHKNDLEREPSELNQSIDFSDANIDQVKKFVEGNENVFFHKGYFPETAIGLPDQFFALVHLDADLYQPTLAGLQYFYPRLSHGGVIIVHDYNHNWDGVTKAVNEFLMTIPENPMEVSDWQGSVMIIRNKKQ